MNFINALAAIAVGGAVFGSAGCQIENNSGDPRLYIGDGNQSFMQYENDALTFGDDISIQPTVTAGDTYDSIGYGGDSSFTFAVEPAAILADIMTTVPTSADNFNVRSAGALYLVARTKDDSSRSNRTSYQTFTAESGYAFGTGGAVTTIFDNPKNLGVKRYAAIASGSVRLVLTQATSGFGLSSTVGVFKNGVMLQEWTLGSVSGTTWTLQDQTLDVAIRASDLLEIKVKASVSTSTTVPIGGAYNIRFRTNERAGAIIPISAL